MRSGVRFLASVFPVLKRVPAIASSISPDRAVPNQTALRAQAFHELKQLLSQLGEQMTLVLFVDDLQWADRDSVALLRAVLLSAGSPQCLFVATTRANAPLQPGAAHALPALDELLAASRVLDLGGLSRQESRSLCAALRPRAERMAAARTLFAPLLDEAAGHPLFLSELVRHLGAVPHAEPGLLHLKDVLWRRYLELDEPSQPLPRAGGPGRRAHPGPRDRAGGRARLQRRSASARRSPRGAADPDQPTRLGATGRAVSRSHSRGDRRATAARRAGAAAAHPRASPAHRPRAHREHAGGPAPGRRLHDRPPSRSSPRRSSTPPTSGGVSPSCTSSPGARPSSPPPTKRRSAHLARGIALLGDEPWRDYALARALL